MVHSLFVGGEAEGDESLNRAFGVARAPDKPTASSCLFGSCEDSDLESRLDSDSGKVASGSRNSSSSTRGRQKTNKASPNQHKRSSCWSKRLARFFKIELCNARAIINKVTMRRQYLFALCLTLVLVSCLVASLVISRSVGELLAEDNSASNSDGQPMRLSSATRELLVEELEPRTIELVDLTECGKTFAFTKWRFQVKVPKSSPQYKQQPAFLNGNQALIEAQASNQQQQKSPTRFHLASISEVAHISGDQFENVSSESKATSTSPFFDTQGLASTENPLTITIKPVADASASRPSDKSDSKEDPLPLFEAALLAITSTNGPADRSGSELTMESSAQINLEDPLEDAAAGLHVDSSALNKSLVDCFLVDTDKRYDQRVLMEDRYRLVASTRKVSFKSMMAIITECRKLTWASLPSTIAIKSLADEPTISESNLQTPTGFNPSPQVQTNRVANQQPNDFLASILSSWMQPPIETGTPKRQQEANLLSDARNITSQTPKRLSLIRGKQPVGGGNLAADPNGGQPEDPEQERKRQASYLNMGISMVSGIVPRTLWCGLGDRAANYSELGAEYKVDSCCRAHDHCPIRLKPFASDYGLVNWSVSTRSHCQCDVDFNDCLAAANSTLSNVIRALYFRLVGLQCIDVERRRVEPSKISSTFN